MEWLYCWVSSRPSLSAGYCPRQTAHGIHPVPSAVQIPILSAALVRGMANKKCFEPPLVKAPCALWFHRYNVFGGKMSCSKVSVLNCLFVEGSALSLWRVPTQNTQI